MMVKKTVDEKINEALMKGTQSAADLKNETWKGIQEDIQFKHHKRGELRMAKREGNRKRYGWVGIASAAAALVIAFSVGTEPGQAAMRKIKEIFAPEKTIVQEMEGNKEKTKVNLSESEMGYVIYVDEAIYKTQKKDGIDRVEPKDKPDGKYPEVYMEIQQVKDKKPVEMAKELEGKLKSTYTTVQNEGQVKSPVEGIALYGRKGDEWNSPVVKYYLVDNQQGGSFVIKQQYFMEASEGHGVRLDNMLKEFKIVELEK